MTNDDADADLKWFVNRLLTCLDYEHFHGLVSREIHATLNESSGSSSSEEDDEDTEVFEPSKRSIRSVK